MARRAFFSFARLFWPFLFTLLSLALTVLVLVSGIGTHVILDNYFITTDLTNFEIRGKLADSTFLQDISLVSGGDWVGGDLSAQKLNLEPKYIVGLFTACGRSSDGNSFCSTPKFGFYFDPALNLNLAGTAAQGTFPDNYAGEISGYSKISLFLGVGYAVGAGSNGLSLLLTILAACFPSMAVVSEVFSFIATLFLFAASITSIVKFSKLKDLFNQTYGPVGIQTTLGLRIYIISFVAFALALIATLSLLYRVRSSAKNKSGPPTRGIETKGGTSGMVTGAIPVGPKPGFLARIPTWKKHKYTQIEKQPAVHHQRNLGPDDDRQGLVAPVEDEFSHEYPEDISMGPIKITPQADRNLNDTTTAYDPYTRPGSGAH